MKVSRILAEKTIHGTIINGDMLVNLLQSYI